MAARFSWSRSWMTVTPPPYCCCAGVVGGGGGVDAEVEVAYLEVVRGVDGADKRL